MIKLLRMKNMDSLRKMDSVHLSDTSTDRQSELDQWTCAFCDISFQTESQFILHTKSSEHISEVKDMDRMIEYEICTNENLDFGEEPISIYKSQQRKRKANREMDTSQKKRKVIPSTDITQQKVNSATAVTVSSESEDEIVSCKHETTVENCPLCNPCFHQNYLESEYCSRCNPNFGMDVYI